MAEHFHGIKKAVIVAAGRSRRLQERTQNIPKSLLPIGSHSLLERSIQTLKSYGIQEIAIVVGYQQETIRQKFSHTENIAFIENTGFSNNNNLASLALCEAWTNNESFLYLHADLIFEPQIFEVDAINDNITLWLDESSIDAEAMKVKLDSNGDFVSSSKDIPLDEAAGEWLGITVFPAGTTTALFDCCRQILDNGGMMEYDTAAFNMLARKNVTFDLHRVGGLKWTEVDFEEDYQRAKELFEKQKS